MLFFNLLAAAAAAIGASAASIAPRARHVADFRVFGAPGCSEKNLGVWTVIDSDIKTGECKDFKDDVIHSVSLTDIDKGCVCESFGRSGIGAPGAF